MLGNKRAEMIKKIWLYESEPCDKCPNWLLFKYCRLLALHEKWDFIIDVLHHNVDCRITYKPIVLQDS